MYFLFSSLRLELTKKNLIDSYLFKYKTYLVVCVLLFSYSLYFILVLISYLNKHFQVIAILFCCCIVAMYLFHSHDSYNSNEYIRNHQSKKFNINIKIVFVSAFEINIKSRDGMFDPNLQKGFLPSVSAF